MIDLQTGRPPGYSLPMTIFQAGLKANTLKWQCACQAFGGFIVSTSANPAGLEPARSLQDAMRYFGQDLNYLNGDLGLSQKPSRIIDAVTGEIIRD